MSTDSTIRMLMLGAIAAALLAACSSPTAPEQRLPDGPIIDARPWTPLNQSSR